MTDFFLRADAAGRRRRIAGPQEGRGRARRHACDQQGRRRQRGARQGGGGRISRRAPHHRGALAALGAAGRRPIRRSPARVSRGCGRRSSTIATHDGRRRHAARRRERSGRRCAARSRCALRRELSRTRYAGARDHRGRAYSRGAVGGSLRRSELCRILPPVYENLRRYDGLCSRSSSPASVPFRARRSIRPDRWCASLRGAAIAAFAGVRRVAHVFATSYEAVDRELPELIARERPDLALDVRACAAHAASAHRKLRAQRAFAPPRRTSRDIVPSAGMIAPGAPATLALRAPAHRLVAAARAGRHAGRAFARCRALPLQLSVLARERARRASRGGPRLVAFVHVPACAPHRALRARASGGPPAFTLGDLVQAGEAIVLAALAAARTRR